MNQSIGEIKLKKIVEQLFKDLEADPDSITKWGHEVTIQHENKTETYVLCGSCFNDGYGVLRFSLDNCFLVSIDNVINGYDELIETDVKYLESEIDNNHE